MPQIPNDSWDKWSNFVLNELGRLADGINAVDVDLKQYQLKSTEQHERQQAEIRLLKFQASLWGSIAGTIFGAIVAVIARSVGQG